MINDIFSIMFHKNKYILFASSDKVYRDANFNYTFDNLLHVLYLISNKPDSFEQFSIEPCCIEEFQQNGGISLETSSIQDFILDYPEHLL